MVKFWGIDIDLLLQLVVVVMVVTAILTFVAGAKRSGPPVAGRTTLNCSHCGTQTRANLQYCEHCKELLVG